jgi:hypothetical protein
VLVSGAGQSKTPIPYRSRYAPELHPDAIDDVKKMLEACENRKDYPINITIHCLNAYKIALPVGPDSYELIDRRNLFLKLTFYDKRILTSYHLGLAFYQTIAAILFAKIDELNIGEWDDIRDNCVESNSLLMLLMVQRLIYGAYPRTPLFNALTSPEFASNLARLGNSPIARERRAVEATLLTFQNALNGVDHGTSRDFFPAALSVMAKRLSSFGNENHGRRYNDLLGISKVLVCALPHEDTAEFREKFSPNLAEYRRDPQPSQQFINIIRALADGGQSVRSGIYAKIGNPSSMLACLVILLLAFAVYSLSF